MDLSPDLLSIAFVIIILTVCTEFSEVFASPIEERASVAILSEMVTGGAQRSRGSSQRPSKPCVYTLKLCI